MADLTRSSNGGPPRPGSASASVVLALLSVAVLPAAILATRFSSQYELLHAGAAIPPAALLAVLALALARRARSRLGPTLGRAKGTRTARVGRLLGLLGLLLALTAAGSIAVYAVLSLVAD